MKRSLAELFLLASLVFGTPEWVRTQTPTTQLQPGAEQNLHVEPGTERACSLAVPVGQVVPVRFEQSNGSISVRWLADGLSAELAKTSMPRINRSGKLSSINFRAIDAAQSVEKGTAGSFQVQNQGKRAVDVRIVVGRARAATREDAQIVQAEEDTAHAVALSANRTPANLSTVMQLLKASEKQWRALNDRVELTRVLALEAYTQAFPMDNGVAALIGLPELIDNAMKIAGTSPVEAANARKTSAFIYAKQAQYDHALEQYNQALPLFEKNDDTYNRVVVLENRAKVERIQGHSDEALADVQLALSLAQQTADSRGELALEVERGAIAFSTGQLGLAYEANLKAIALTQETHDDFLEGLAWSDMGVVYTELRDFDAADHALDHADAIWKRTANAYGHFQTSEDRAEMRLAKGDLSGARTAFAAGAEEAEKGSLGREQLYFLRGLAVSEMRSGQLVEARKHIDQAVLQVGKIHATDGLSAIYASAGDLEALQGKWKEAALQWKHADSVALERSDTLDHVIALGGLVRSALELGDVTAASEQCQSAMSALESIRAGIMDADLRLSFFSSRHALYDLCVQTALRASDFVAAFDIAERGRARWLLDRAAASGIRDEFPNSLLNRIQQNEKRLAQERNRLGHYARPTRSRSSVTGLLQERDKLRTEAEQSGLSVTLAAATLPLRQVEVRRKLDADTALLTYWLSEKSGRVWWITSKGISSYPLPGADALKHKTELYMADLLSPLSMKVGGSAVERNRTIAQSQLSALAEGRALYRLLLPIQIPAQIHRLLIVKDEALLPLSFAALPSPLGGYLGQRLQVATEPSVTLAFQRRNPPSSGAERKVVVFADPTGTLVTQENSVASVAPESRRRPELDHASWVVSLPFARQEAQLIRQTFGEENTTVFAGKSASREQALALNWSSYSVAHFATHAIYRDSHLELSGLLLGSQDASALSVSQPEKASILSYSDVLRMKARLRLVVLSACSSNVGKFVPGEGVLALDNAFLAAGTSTVIGTLWPVDDEASSIFMHSFYQALAGNHSPLLSLQIAQKGMAASSQWSAPYYWGTFSLSGDWHSLSD